ncbi:MAG: efflux RND transporter periplasmic adaptor subunit [Hyphomicrobiaceae bacterium]|nr:efflux RND transporter periplasmic adaptor subunit [Hyphomicrobiaceae bacterium]
MAEPQRARRDSVRKPLPPPANAAVEPDYLASLAALPLGRETEPRRWLFWGASTLVVLGGLAAVAMSWLPTASPAPSRFQTSPVVTGDLTVRVTATGTLEPTRIVEVSTELSGLIRTVLVDNNDHVEAGQTLAELDTSTIEDEHARAGANVDVAKAKLKEAELEEKVLVEELARKRRLAGAGHTAQRDLTIATADAARVGARIEALRAELLVAEAEHRISTARLGKARIVAPIDGVVLRRNIEPGQTVAASLSAPVLFRLAPGLDDMQVRVDVDEADAMKVKPGQAATFEVHALKEEYFPASVKMIYIGPEIVEGVVTYKAILTFDNAKLNLKPGMSANADIEVDHVSDVRLVPNAALRFVPPAALSERSADDGLLVRQMAAAWTDPGAGASSVAPAPLPTVGLRPEDIEPKRKIVHVVRDGAAVPVSVLVGATDGTLTEIRSGDLRPGDQVAVELLPAGG